MRSLKSTNVHAANAITSCLVFGLGIGHEIIDGVVAEARLEHKRLASCPLPVIAARETRSSSLPFAAGAHHRVRNFFLLRRGNSSG